MSALVDQSQARPIGAVSDPSASDRKPGSGEVPLRPEIAQSWQRCQAMGVAPQPDDLPYYEEINDARLLRAAKPVIDRLADQLHTAPVTILLADHEATIVDRRVGQRELMMRLDRLSVAPGFSFSEEYAGTNGLGTTLEVRTPFVVRGEEHLLEPLRSLGCVGAPIVHPVKRSVVGILDITCDVDDVNELMSPLISNAIRDIETRLFEDASRREQHLLQEYIRSCRRGNSAVIAMSGGTVIATPTASRIVDSTDQLMIWDWITNHLGAADEHDGRLRLSGGTEVRIRGRRISDPGDTLSAVLELRPMFSAEPQAARPILVPRSTSPARLPQRQTLHRERLPGRSEATYRLQGLLDELANTVGPVLLTGEPGVGKTYVATYLQRRWGNGSDLLTVDAASLTAATIERLVETVGGNHPLILTHLDNAPSELHGLLTRVVEAATSGSAPLIATTGVEAADDGAHRLRAHFHRRADIAPLRQRMDELADLSHLLLAEQVPDRQTPRLQSAAHRALAGHHWPGNVRELASVLNAAVNRSMGFDIKLEDLPAEYRSSGGGRSMSSLERAERETIVEALDAADGNKSLAAERLGIARSTLYRKIRALGLEGGRFTH